MARASLEHEGAHKVVRDEVQGEFLLDARGGLAARDVHARGDLDVAQEQFDAPSPAVELGEDLGGIAGRVEQRGGDGEGPGPESGDGHAYREVAEAQRGGQAAIQTASDVLDSMAAAIRSSKGWDSPKLRRRRPGFAYSRRC